MRSKMTWVLAAALGLAIPAVALAGTCSASVAADKAEQKMQGTPVAVATAKTDIVDTAAAAGKFNTLLAAAKAAGLVDALKGEGPLTVFAPTDEAFAALPEGTVANLLKPENKDQLVAVLTYHVVAGKAMAADVAGLESAKTLQGQSLALKVVDGKVMINDAQVIAADVTASNGVIHVINKVLIPAAK